MIRRALLSVPTFPDAVPERVLESAVTLTQLLGAHLTAQLPQLNSDPATWPVVVGAFPLDFPALMNEMVVKSEGNAAASAERLTRLCAESGVALDMRRGLTTPYAMHSMLTDQARVLQVMLTAPLELTHKVLPSMAASRWGRIVNIASLAGFSPGSRGHTTYSAIKSALIKFSLASGVRNAECADSVTFGSFVSG